MSKRGNQNGGNKKKKQKIYHCAKVCGFSLFLYIFLLTLCVGKLNKKPP